MHKLFLVSLLSVFVFLTSCSKNVSPNSYQASEVGVASKVTQGIIIGKRAIAIDANSNMGGLAGASAGGVGGSAIGGGSRGNIVGAIGGAVVGGVIGHAADKAVNSHKGIEYIIKLKNGSTISIAQVEDLNLSINQKVLVIYGAMTRVVPDETTGGGK